VQRGQNEKSKNEERKTERSRGNFYRLTPSSVLRLPSTISESGELGTERRLRDHSLMVTVPACIHRCSTLTVISPCILYSCSSLLCSPPSSTPVHRLALANEALANGNLQSSFPFTQSLLQVSVQWGL
jgi:hypothetical protein